MQALSKYLAVSFLLSALTACQPGLEDAENHLRDGRWQEAQQTLTQVLQQEPDSFEAQVLLAETRFYTEGLSAALTALRELYAQEPEHPALQRGLKALKVHFVALDELRESKDAAALQRYLDEVPNDFLAERVRWLLYRKTNRQDQALLSSLARSQDPLLQQLVAWEQAREAPERFAELLERFPDSPFCFAWYDALTSLHWQQERPAEAHSLLVRWKGELSDRDPQKAHVLLKQAEYSTEKQPAAALNYYQTYLRLFPTHPAGRQTIYTVREDFKERLGTADHRWLAEAAHERYMYQTAYAELSQVPPRSLQDHWQLAEYAMKAKYYPQARQHYETLKQRYPGSQEAGLATVALATLQRLNKAYGPARQQLAAARSAYTRQPRVQAAALWEEGILYDLQNKDADRARVYHQLLELDPEYEHAMEALWYALWHDYRQRDYARVIRDLTRFARYYEDHSLKPRFVYWLGRSHEALEQWDEAEAAYRQLENNPLMDYYTHRARARLKVLKQGGDDDYATTAYTGYQREVATFPSYAQAFEAAVKGDALALSPLQELLLLGQTPEFMQLASLSQEPRWQVLYGLQLQREGRYYDAVTRYRYLATKDDVYLPAAFPLAFFDHIESEAAKYQMNPFLAAGLIWQESQYKPDIQSWVGATGLMQIMPATGQQIAAELQLTDYDLTHAETNIQMGVWYLHTRHKTFEGNSLLAVASYNAGAGPVYRWLKQFGHLPYDALAESITYPETRGYVKHVFTSYWIYQHLYGRSGG
ncbi:MAG: transglycosylase SLT domain-containing protein [Candidatus Sericytochromatia bacterium]|nr:transglycosylase SLT domain-containing protein [Candidatus Sericytochromatia bacterium]